MAKLVILGSSYAVPDEHHENTHMALVGEQNMVLIDCVGTPVVRLKRAGLDFNDITDIILTHFHPDHVSGVPLLLMDMWLLGRQRPLRIYGLHYTLDCMQKLMSFYDWENWPNFFPVSFHRLPDNEMTLVMETNEFTVFSSPVRHFLPTIGVRVEFQKQVLAYSCDTEPCPALVGLARDADMLIHEATGETPGHSSAAQAAAIATEAGAKSLCLIHYRTGDFDYNSLVPEAKAGYNGPVTLAQDFMEFEFE